jgi:uncharacterized protein YecE (DUF72 family)
VPSAECRRRTAAAIRRQSRARAPCNATSFCVQAMRTPQIRIGCSGWNYASWKGTFYPADVPATRWLRFYAGIFDTVEVNGTSYRLPEAPTFAAWREQTPASFLMAVKASRFLTHLKRLRDPEEPLARLFSRASHLGERLGPALYQLPASFHLDLARLDAFLAVVPRRLADVPGGAFPRRTPIRHVMEFRHPSWFVQDTWDLLNHHDVGLCLHDKAEAAILDPIVGPVLYVRFHGTSGRYHGSYSARALDAWAARLVEQHREGRDVFAYFNNDPDAVATYNARELRALVERRLGNTRAPDRPKTVVLGPRAV